MSHLHKVENETVVVELLGSPSSTLRDLYCILVICEKPNVDGCDSSHAFLSPSFEKHTISIGSRLLIKMGYTRGGHGKNGQGIYVPIVPKMKTSKVGLGYASTSNPIPTSNSIEFEKVSFFASGAQTKLLEENSSSNQVAWNDKLVDNVIVNENVAIVNSFPLVFALGFEFVE